MKFVPADVDHISLNLAVIFSQSHIVFGPSTFTWQCPVISDCTMEINVTHSLAGAAYKEGIHSTPEECRTYCQCSYADAQFFTWTSQPHKPCSCLSHDAGRSVRFEATFQDVSGVVRGCGGPCEWLICYFFTSNQVSW